ncbi:MAG: precorrin-3B C(17)-methyltransferase [Spirochaetaceae bacterium]|jgi:precorrin-3B C17-methyltransferase|nr:precorrin-3B C(17)-methyltransferase [Spirochaetaceae bacterium]
MGTLTVAGIGPGGAEGMTAACRAALEQADIITGYDAYIELVRPLYPHKEYLSTPMKSEIERCRESLRLASGGGHGKSGKKICLISSGDSGVYGMASPVLELAADFPDVTIELAAGVTAALSGGALLGAPLANDFAVLSLSDLLTPWETIEKRLRAAAAGDFSICLYNPGSSGRKDSLRRAVGILLETLPCDRVCGITRCIGREGESAALTTLGELERLQPDMNMTVFIGNSQTKPLAGKMVTPRGYKK